MKLSLKIKDDLDIEVPGTGYGVNLNIQGIYDRDQLVESMLN